MAENDKELRWTVILDWLNIVSMLNLSKVNQISEIKKLKALRRITKTYGSEKLITFEPDYLEEIVVKELRELMKKELLLMAKKEKERIENLKNRVMPFKGGGVFKLDPKDLKEFNGDPEKLLKHLYKKFRQGEEDKDDDKKEYKEDNDFYFI